MLNTDSLEILETTSKTSQFQFFSNNYDNSINETENDDQESYESFK